MPFCYKIVHFDYEGFLESSLMFYMNLAKINRWEFYIIIIPRYVQFLKNACGFTLVAWVTWCLWLAKYWNISNLKVKQPIDVILGTKICGNNTHNHVFNVFNWLPWQLWIDQCWYFDPNSNLKQKSEISSK